MSGIFSSLENKLDARMGPVVIELKEVKKVMEKNNILLEKILKVLAKNGK